MSWQNMLRKDWLEEYGLTQEEYDVLEREVEREMPDYEIHSDLKMWAGEKDGRIELFLDRDILDSKGYKEKNYWILGNLIEYWNEQELDIRINERLDKIKEKI